MMLVFHFSVRGVNQVSNDLPGLKWYIFIVDKS